MRLNVQEILTKAERIGLLTAYEENTKRGFVITDDKLVVITKDAGSITIDRSELKDIIDELSFFI